MAPPYLPRVPAFPIVGERSVLTVLGTGLNLPATVNDECPLIGKPAPEINLPDHLGRRCSLKATIALGRPIILFFFPLAGSPHCTKESCMFRDALGLTPIFIDFQAIVIGISQDPPSRSKRFVDEHQLGYRILHDEKRDAMETYGVARTWMGLIDQRCTFIIDPNGIVRSMIQGVMNADAHVMFAEKWLIRLEHELSQRARIMTALETPPDDLMLDPATEDALRKMRVAYGDLNSANMGGIDAAPRYGAVSTVSRKQPKSVHRYESHSTLQNEHDSQQREASAKDKNMWKQWKTLFQQLSSPDDQPPPAVMARIDAAAAAAAATSSSSSSSSHQHAKTSPLRMPSHKGGNNVNSLPTLPRTRSSGRLKDLGKSLRRGSSSASAAAQDATATDRLNGSANDPSDSASSSAAVPPVPPLFAATVDAFSPAGSASITSPRANSYGVESESSDRETSTWGTDSSLSSHVSTAATSVLGSSTRHAVNGGSIMQNGQQYWFAKPSVTSEVLMPGDVLDLSKGPPPVVVRAIPQHPPPSVSAAPLHPPTSFDHRSIAARKPAPAPPSPTTFNGDTGVSRGGVPNAIAPQRPARTNRKSSLTASSSSPSLTQRADAPTDVPQDELEDDILSSGDKEEYVSLNDRGVLHVQGKDRPLAADTTSSQSSSRHASRTGPVISSNVVSVLENSLGSNSRTSTPHLGSSSGPAMTAEDEDITHDITESPSGGGRRSSATYQSLRAQRHRSASITDGVFRIQTPTLADAAEPSGVPEIGKSLSPRPRSVTSRDGNRLRRPMAAPRDHVVELAHRASQMSMADSYDSERSASPMHNGNVTSANGAVTPVHDPSTATIQRAVRKASLRAEPPKLADRPRVVSIDRSLPSSPARKNSITSVTSPHHGSTLSTTVPPPSTPPTLLQMSATQSPDSPLTHKFTSSGLPPPQPPQKTMPQSTPLLAALEDFAQRSADNDMRRPSVSSMGTFGRRGSND